MHRRLLPLVLAAAATLSAAPAAAQKGVFVDPESPSGKEYQLPLESARRQADPNARRDRKVAPGERSAPLFGEGIESDDAAPAAAGGGTRGGSGGDRPRGRSRRRAAARPPVTESAAEAVRAAASRPGAPDGGIGTTLAVLGGAAIVLLAGGLAGYAMRRRPGPIA